jgi:hypothetical protein
MCGLAVAQRETRANFPTWIAEVGPPIGRQPRAQDAGWRRADATAKSRGLRLRADRAQRIGGAAGTRGAFRLGVGEMTQLGRINS